MLQFFNDIDMVLGMTWLSCIGCTLFD